MKRREFLALAAAAPFALRAGAADALRGATALVTCDTEARVAVVDLGSGRVSRSIPVTPGPRAIERVGSGLALICHTVTGTVTVLDGRSGEIRHVLEAFPEPRYAARHSDGVHAFVSDSGDEVVASLDVQRGTVLGRVQLGGWARHLSLSPDARTLWVGLGNDASRISIVDVSDPRKPRFIRSIAPPFLAHDVGFFPDGRHVWVTAGETGKTAIYRADGTLVRALPADGGPQHVTFGGHVAYVSSGAAGTFRVHAHSGAMLRETRIPIGSYNVQAGPGGLVLTPSLDRGTLTVVGASGRVVHEVLVSASSHDACFVF
ncbi:MAG TPA: hypothetical protein VGM80_03890 [Gaiellaceae bacterium]